MSERDDAIRTIKDRITKALYALEVPSRNPYDAYPELKDAEIAIKRLTIEPSRDVRSIAYNPDDKLAVEPGEDARELVVSWAKDHFEIMPDEESLIDLMKDITSRDERIRAEALREAGDKAVEYVFFEGDSDPIDENGFQAPSISSGGLRAAILAPKEAHDERTE